TPTQVASTRPATGQVASKTDHKPQEKSAPLFNTQVHAAAVTPTPPPIPPSFRTPLRQSTLTQYFSSYHPAIDMAANYGSPIYSINHGTVVNTGYILAGGGLMVQISHRDGYTSYYAHLSSIQVSRNQSVTNQ